MTTEKRKTGTDHALHTALEHHRAGRLPEAGKIYRRILQTAPRHPDVLHLLGMALYQEGQTEEAIKLIRQAIKINPASPIFYNNLGEIYRHSKNYQKALDCYRKAAEKKPDFAEPYKNTGSLYKETGDYSQAVEFYKRAIAIRPDYADACYSLGNALQEQGRHKEALKYYQMTSTLKPDHIAARWAYAMTQVPVMLSQGEDPAVSRSSFLRELDALDAWLASHGSESAYDAVGNQHPFYLAYQQENNRDLLARCGRLYSDLMQEWQIKHQLLMNAHAPGRRIRLGIVSAHIRNHSVWNAIVRGWLIKLDRQHFEIHLFHTGSTRDQETKWAQAHSDSFTEHVPNLTAWVKVILGKQPDVLIYPEIGMHRLTTKLASMRLAPVQMAAWGHPETTGLPTMDYYLSAEMFEPERAQDFYTERLVPLPGLGCYYEAGGTIPREPDFDSLHIDPELPVMICPGAPFKYNPAFDHVFPAITRRLGECQFVFFTHKVQDLSTRLEERLGAAFADAGVDIQQHVIFIPWQDRARFHGLMQHADVFLDTIGFSGFNTAIQAIECTLPPVTLQGRFMRGRFASGILQRLGLEALIATNTDEYIEACVRLVTDSAYNRSTRAIIRGRRHILFRDTAPVDALEELLRTSVRR
jgi:predicted O-linked N-acetylglucosamine transferase (SPINDLY family)